MIYIVNIIKASQPEDAESLIVLYPEKQGGDREKSLRTFRRHFEEVKNGNRILYVLKNGDTTIGTVSLLFRQDNPDETRLFGPDTGHINHLRIHPDYQGRRLSSILNSRLEEDARSMGIKTLTIGVEPANQKAIEVYSHWGYEKFLEYQGDPGHGNQEKIIGMKKELDQDSGQMEYKQ